MSYSIWLVDLIAMRRSEAVVLVQNYGLDIHLLTMLLECLVQWDRQVIEGRYRSVW
jgi:hypothetical protein